MCIFLASIQVCLLCFPQQFSFRLSFSWTCAYLPRTTFCFSVTCLSYKNSSNFCDLISFTLGFLLLFATLHQSPHPSLAPSPLYLHFSSGLSLTILKAHNTNGINTLSKNEKHEWQEHGNVWQSLLFQRSTIITVEDILSNPLCLQKQGNSEESTSGELNYKKTKFAAVSLPQFKPKSPLLREYSWVRCALAEAPFKSARSKKLEL